MKFEKKYPDASYTDRFEFEYSFVTKSPKLGWCTWCRSNTKWFDIVFQTHACSEECLSQMWKRYKDDQKQKSTYENFENHFAEVKKELEIASRASQATKDILIVVRDQLDYFKACIESIRENTKDYTLYIWDNASSIETQDYILQLMREYEATEDPDWSIVTMRSEKNTGFIHPNNQMAGWGKGDYLILLNSDTKVFENWDRALIGFLAKNPEVAQVGYWGGHMGPDGRGFGGANGYDVDYIPGWCFCMRREDYQRFGLFDNQLIFAYCEDADLSLRLKESGRKIYSLHAPLVHHYQNKTVIQVEKEGEINIAETFQKNHEYMKKRWKDYLEKDRVLLHTPELRTRSTP